MLAFPKPANFGTGDFIRGSKASAIQIPVYKASNETDNTATDRNQYRDPRSANAASASTGNRDMPALRSTNNVRYRKNGT